MAKRKEQAQPKRKAPPPPPKGNQRALGNRGGGRPTEYIPDHAETAYKLALLGATDAEMADIFCIAESTLNDWKEAHPEFSLALSRGKAPADANVAHSLYRRALGYTHKAVKIFNNDGTPMIVDYEEHYLPDTAAAKHWLNNRRPQSWRDRIEHTGEGGGAVRFIIDGLDDRK